MKNLKIMIPVLLLVLGGVYKFVLAKPPVTEKPKITGEVYILQKDFLINLKSGRYAKLSAAVVLAPGYLAEATKSGHAETMPPTGYGALPQEAVIRSIVTEQLTDSPAADLQHEKSRIKIQKAILKRIQTTTDVKAQDVLFTDVAIQ
jgi:flagellar basal body-associated protein FliL